MHMYNPPHPGEVLRDYLEGVSITQAADALKITRAQLSRILNGHAAITADMALRLAALLDTSPEMWADMQSEYALWQESQKPRPVIRPLRSPLVHA
ncbi:HigA family addiction module antidote protein [Salmonella enterica]|uniref:HigA family addiction module antidote protein n=2 Tax=Salmonella enterica TaxID=28901 RepID=A0A619I1A8_SALER|nr:addiction module antidote protein, HigA family [Salmonella enterica]EBV8497097.1 addiction module antidote protein, HigA family [Salmonella enterica subsp. enterica serovar Java]ECF1924114.1 addiction module antidote protein, HigA family [Salmonella enterica subsp. enterica serovar Newport]ECJ2363446.1 HigA family addiction module antidote protein [Salmonella enterica subsp. diarizonae]EAT8555843.1 addiction module antidote protein, HigA family [Salmonella enterica]